MAGGRRSSIRPSRLSERIHIPYTRYRPSKLSPEEYWEQGLDRTLDDTTIL